METFGQFLTLKIDFESQKSALFDLLIYQKTFMVKKCYLSLN